MAWPPALPPELTAHHWDKNRGAAAALQGKTGVSEALRALVTAYHAVDWDAFDPTKTPGEGKPRWMAAIDAKIKGELGNITALRRALDTAATKLTATAAKYKAAKTVPDSSVKFATDLATKAKNLGVYVGDTALANATRAVMKAVKAKVDATAVLFTDALKKTVSRTDADLKVMLTDAAAIAKLKAGDERSAGVKKLGGKLFDTARNYTQVLTNMLQFTQAGYDFGIAEAKLDEVDKKLTPLSNKSSGKVFAGGEDDATIKASLVVLAEVHNWAKTVA